MADNFVTTKITGAAFSDGSTLSGSWTAEYDPTGLLVAVTNATFVVSGSGGTTTFNGMGTLPYANKPSNTSYEIHSTTTPVGGSYHGLYIDWRTETPSSFYEGSPSLFTSVLNSNSSSPATPLRLKNDGVSGTGAVPVISGLPVSESGNDAAVLTPFGNVTVTDTDTATSATITLSFNGAATDADGVLSGTGLTRTATGTYGLAFTSPANLTAELKALKFTPTAHQVGVGSTVATAFGLSINDTDGSASAGTTLTVTAVATCFVRGTMIATPSGEAAVESLRAGDLVTVSEGGIRVSRLVTWIGSGSLDAADFDDRDQAFPIRIRKDAFADDVPQRDLLVTQEHCILTPAGLTPARMLVNGRSIVIDRCTPVYDFFHVELESHAILLAEGLAAESYLDTGNRDLFIDAHASVCARPATTMAAPLAVARALVEPIWTRLRDRARGLGLGFDGNDSVCAVTDQPDLRLLLDDGRELSARWHNGRRHMFHIPCGTRPVRLLSRTAVPADVVGPFVDDRRTLGVAVDRLVLWNGLDDTVISVADLMLDGWHAAEGTHRWTNGKARLHLPEAEAETFLDVHLNATALYPVLRAA